MRGEHPLQRDKEGQLLVDQGEHHGRPVTYNPDDGLFYLHAPGNLDGTQVEARFAGDLRGWANLLYFAKRKAAKAVQP